MRQTTLAQQAEFQKCSKKTRREQFLEEMNAVMPWAETLAVEKAQEAAARLQRRESPVSNDEE